MSNIQREKEIIDLLKSTSYASVDSLSQKLFISPSSIRRDLTSLEKQGLVRRTHGGVSLLTASPGMAPFSIRIQENKREKLLIVKTAAKLIPQDAVIFIDSSTTALHFASLLKSEMNLTVFTNNMQLSHLLTSKHIKTFCIGGLVSEYNNVITTGSFAMEMINNIYVDLMFFTSSALSEDGTITDSSENESAIRKVMLPHSASRVFLCPISRFGLLSPYKVTSASEVDYIITDIKLPETFTNKFKHVTFLC